MARARLRHQTTRAHDHVTLDPRHHAQAVPAETDLEGASDDGVGVTGGDRPFDLHLTHRLGHVVERVGGHRSQGLDQLVRGLHVNRMVATVRFTYLFEHEGDAT